MSSCERSLRSWHSESPTASSAPRRCGTSTAAASAAASWSGCPRSPTSCCCWRPSRSRRRASNRACWNACSRGRCREPRAGGAWAASPCPHWPARCWRWSRLGAIFRDDVNLAHDYRATLTEGGGKELKAARLYRPGDQRAGVAFGYDGISLLGGGDRRSLAGRRALHGRAGHALGPAHAAARLPARSREPAAGAGRSRSGSTRSPRSG